MDAYRHPDVDIIVRGFRPLSGYVADFCVVEHCGAYHFFYIERKPEGTPFYPGNEIYFGHASTADFFAWEVHNPVMLIRPGTWEEGHVWAPFILKHEGRFVMAYTGLNYSCSQDIGLAFSSDLFHWERSPSNPISPAKDRPWSHWSQDHISSCRDPHLLIHDGWIYMTYTANTARGEACVAMARTADLETWEDCGPILVSYSDGYEPVFAGGHKQASLESTNLLNRNGRWYLIVNAALRDTSDKHHIIASDRMDRFDLQNRRLFWRDGGCIEVVKECGNKALLAGCVGGTIKFGEVDWSAPLPTAETIGWADQLARWAGQTDSSIPS